jgi:hypothetical protein
VGAVAVVVVGGVNERALGLFDLTGEGTVRGRVGGRSVGAGDGGRSEGGGIRAGGRSEGGGIRTGGRSEGGGIGGGGRSEGGGVGAGGRSEGGPRGCNFIWEIERGVWEARGLSINLKGISKKNMREKT